MGWTNCPPRGPRLQTCLSHINGAIWITIRMSLSIVPHLFAVKCLWGGFHCSIPPQNHVGSSIFINLSVIFFSKYLYLLPDTSCIRIKTRNKWGHSPMRGRICQLSVLWPPPWLKLCLQEILQMQLVKKWNCNFMEILFYFNHLCFIVIISKFFVFIWDG